MKQEIEVISRPTFGHMIGGSGMGMKHRVKVSNENEGVTLFDALEDFEEHKRAEGVVDKTIKDYLYGVKKFIEYYDIDESFRLDELEQQQLYQYQNHLSKQPLSFRSINTYMRNLGTFLYWCDEQKYLTFHPIINKVKGQEKRIKYYTEEEMQRLLVKPVDNNNYGAWRTWAIVCFIYATGARAQSVCDLKMEDIDFYHKEITFSHQKNKSLLVLPLSRELERVLKEYIRKCNLKNEEYVFPNIGGEKANPDALYKAMRRYCESRGVEKRGIHAIRHAFASQYIRNGGNPMKLQKILNHSTVAMTQRYIKLFGQDLKVNYSDFSPLDTAMKSKSRTKKVGK